MQHKSFSFIKTKFFFLAQEGLFFFKTTSNRQRAGVFSIPGWRLIITKANFLSETGSEQNTDRFKQATPHFWASRSFTLSPPPLTALSVWVLTRANKNHIFPRRQRSNNLSWKYTVWPRLELGLLQIAYSHSWQLWSRKLSVQLLTLRTLFVFNSWRSKEKQCLQNSQANRACEGEDLEREPARVRSMWACPTGHFQHAW